MKKLTFAIVIVFWVLSAIPAHSAEQFKPFEFTGFFDRDCEILRQILRGLDQSARSQIFFFRQNRVLNDAYQDSIVEYVDTVGEFADRYLKENLLCKLDDRQLNTSADLLEEAGTIMNQLKIQTYYHCNIGSKIMVYNTIALFEIKRRSLDQKSRMELGAEIT